MIVRSSISNSNDRIPHALWGKVWLITLLLFLGFLGAWEAFWRFQRFKPSLNDDPGLWALARKRASQGGQSTVALIGASRIQLDINLDAFAALTSTRPLQLAIDGASLIPVLRHLSN